MASKIEFKNKNEINISVIVTTHVDTEAYIEECLESIKKQTEDPYEVIVVVDGFRKPMIYPNTKTIIYDKNYGVSFARDQGVKLSTGNYILFVDGDDVLPENFISDMKSFIRQFKGDIYYPSAILWSNWGESNLKNGLFVPPAKISLKVMKKQNYVLVTSVMKKEVYDIVGGFDPNLSIFEDYKFFLQALQKNYKFVRVHTYMKYRQRTNSRNRQSDEEKKRVYNMIRKEIYGNKE